MTTVERINENAKDNSIRKSEEGFTKDLNFFDTDNQFREGDVIEIPENYEVFKQVFGKKPNGEENYGEFIVCNVTNTADHSTRAVNFFPSSLMRTLFPVKLENGKVERNGAPIHTAGTAVDHLISFRGKEAGKNTIQLFMDDMKKKKIKVSIKDKVTVQVWRNGARVEEVRETNLYNYDL